MSVEYPSPVHGGVPRRSQQILPQVLRVLGGHIGIQVEGGMGRGVPSLEGVFDELGQVGYPPLSRGGFWDHWQLQGVLLVRPIYPS
jgi:hypothetical protein